MRKITRATLPKRTFAYLHRKQSEVNRGRDPQKVWKNARKTKTMGKVAGTLAEMSGNRQRCMYCEDSRGTEIDHFWPKTPYKRKTFLWENMLWVCGGCNRVKGDRFDLDDNGRPLLIDPSSEDPWDFLFFEPHTGNITAKIDPASGTSNRKGEHTTNPCVLPLNIEPITDGRRRAFRRLRRAVARFLDRADGDADRDKETIELLEEISDNTDFGLANWYFLGDGGNTAPFSELRDGHADVWSAIAELLGC